MFVGPFSDIWQYLWHPEPFHAFKIGCFAKTFNGWLPLNVVAGWLCHTCVTGTWVTSWIDVILIWYHYIVICTLVTTFNWWLSSKDMKFRVLIKEVLVVFHWLTLRIILLCSLVSGHWALFLVQETIQELLYIYIYIYIYICIICYILHIVFVLHIIYVLFTYYIYIIYRKRAKFSQN